jgi:hypothetical protein
MQIMYPYNSSRKPKITAPVHELKGRSVIDQNGNKGTIIGTEEVDNVAIINTTFDCDGTGYVNYYYDGYFYHNADDYFITLADDFASTIRNDMTSNTRTPMITVPLAELKVGMRVQQESGESGTIKYIDRIDLEFPIAVEFDNDNDCYWTYFTADGYPRGLTRKGSIMLVQASNQSSSLASRSPTITAPLSDLNIGMTVVNESGDIGIISNIDLKNAESINAITVDFYTGEESYAANGYRDSEFISLYSPIINKNIAVENANKQIKQVMEFWKVARQEAIQIILGE